MFGKFQWTRIMGQIRLSV